MQRVKHLYLVAPALLLLAGAVACSDSGGGGTATPSAPPDAHKGPHIRGEITQFEAPVEGKSTGAVVVEGEIDKDTLYDKAILRLTEATTFFKRAGSNDSAATVKDLAEGVRVEITFEGPISEIQPVQSRAGKIVILE